MNEVDYGKRLIVESIVDANTGEQHYDAAWIGNTGSISIDGRVHYEGQTRVRKMHMLLARRYKEGNDAAYKRCTAIFDDIRKAIVNNTAEFYTRGIKTPTTFHAFTMAIIGYTTHDNMETLKEIGEEEQG